MNQLFDLDNVQSRVRFALIVKYKHELNVGFVRPLTMHLLIWN